jgi:hypothetical protein
MQSFDDWRRIMLKQRETGRISARAVGAVMTRKVVK